MISNRVSDLFHYIFREYDKQLINWYISDWSPILIQFLGYNVNKIWIVSIFVFYFYLIVLFNKVKKSDYPILISCFSSLRNNVSRPWGSCIQQLQDLGINRLHHVVLLQLLLNHVGQVNHLANFPCCGNGWLFLRWNSDKTDKFNKEGERMIRVSLVI